MYKNYKIDKDGKLKFDGGHYRIAPERRKAEITDEWQKRLNGISPKPYKRKARQKTNTGGIRVIHLVYVIGFFLLMSIISLSNTYKTEDIMTGNSINITMNNVDSSIGNNLIKPSNGNMFLNIDLDIQNKSISSYNINFNNIIMTDSTGIEYKAAYYNYQNQEMSINLNPKNNTISKLTFEVPLTYKGELKLSYMQDKYNIQNIRTIVIN